MAGHLRTPLKDRLVIARILITGSSTGLGLLAGRRLVQAGHDVIFHARNAGRAAEMDVPGSRIVTGDLASTAQTRQLAGQVNELGPVDAVIHNAGVYGNGQLRSAEGIPATFAVNVLAPYLLTALVPAQRLVYLSSGMHQVRPVLSDPLWQNRQWSGAQAYSESKFYVTALAMAVARLRPHVFSNAVDPGWVPTRMGVSGAPDDLEEGAETQIALAIGEGGLAKQMGAYLHHMAVRDPAAGTRNVETQQRLLTLCEELTGERFGVQPAP